jgi:photosystem II stability/assembly factor-like uncharacterized protein
VTWRPASNNLVHGAITALYADSLSSSVLVGLTQTGDSLSQRDGLWTSDDRGAHWRPVDLDRNDLAILRITRNADGSHILLGANGGDRYPSSYVYSSPDGGATWQETEVLPFAPGATNTLRDLVADPRDPARLFLTTYGGDLYSSQDAGATWAPAPTPKEFRGYDEPGPALLAIDAAHPEMMLLARNLGSGPAAQIGIARSVDGGRSWRSTAAAGLPQRGEIVSFSPTGSGGYLLSTGAGSYRSTDQGATWQPLEGPLSSGSVATFLELEGAPRAMLAASGHGLFVSRDGGGLWQPIGSGLPVNLTLLGLLADARQPEVLFGIPDRTSLSGAAKPPSVLRSSDRGRTWTAASQGMPDAQPGAWAQDLADPSTLFLASDGSFSYSTNGGVTWATVALPSGSRTALTLSLSEPNVMYLGGNPLLHSRDRGLTWEAVPVTLTPGAQQEGVVTGIVVDPIRPQQLWTSTDDGIYESSDGGRSWRRAGLDGRPVRWLTGVVQPGGAGVALTIYAGVEGDGVYRLGAREPAWTPASSGLPAGSTLLSLRADTENPGTLWANRDGGGLYRSTDGGTTWASIGAALGDNLVTALTADPRDTSHVLAATATAGIWSEATLIEGAPQQADSPAADARIEILWPHDWAPVSEAQQANLSLRLFKTGSLLLPPCTWSPDVTIWQAVNNEPATPLGGAEQRRIEGAPFPVWDMNDVDVSRANDPDTKLYFMVRVEGNDPATSVWAHAADARTFLPFPVQPSGVASAAALRSVDTYVQIVWPHDESGNLQPTETASLANVAIAVFQHGTRLSAPAAWRSANITLYGAWDHEIAQVLSRQSKVQMRKAGAISYPVWEFTNIPVARAGDPGSKLYLWAMVEGVETYPAIWAHGADARTLFPATDQPIQGCMP